MDSFNTAAPAGASSLSGTRTEPSASPLPFKFFPSIPLTRRLLLAGTLLLAMALSASVQAHNLVLSETKLTVQEGHGDSFDVRLDSQPSEAVTVTLTRTGSSDVTFDTDPTTAGNQSTLEFTPSNWIAAQAVTVITDWDSDRTDDKATVNFTGNLINSASVGVTVLDDGDQVGMTGASQGGVVRITGKFPSGSQLLEGSTNTYTIKLQAQPESDRTVTVSEINNPDVTVDTNPELSGNQNTLTFTPSNWNQWQAVTFHVAHDSDKVDETVRFRLRFHGNFGGSLHTGASIYDDDVELILSPTSLNMNEGGTKTFEAKLDVQGDTRIVNLSSTNPDVTVRRRNSSVLYATELHFHANKKETYTVQVTAAHDADKTDDSATINLTGTRGTVSGSVNVTVIDDDKAALVLSPTSLTMNEGQSKTFSVKLNSRPSAGVTITLARTGSGDVTFDTNTAAAGNQNTLAFTTSNWNTAREVTVSAAHDDDKIDDSTTINLTGAGVAAGSVEVTVLDDDVGLSWSNFPSTIQEGASENFTVRLDKWPGNNRTVSLSSSNSDVTFDTDPDEAGNQTSMTLAASNWNTGRTVTIRAAHDADKTNDNATIYLTMSESGFSSLLNLKVIDDDDVAVGLELSATELPINEGSSKTFTVKLAAQPGKDRTVSLSSNNSDVTVDVDTSTAGNQTTLTFTASNWSAEQTVTVTAAHDTDKLDETATISLTGTGITAGSVNAAVTDDDKDELVLSPTSLKVSEGGTNTFSVKLSAQPSAGVTITLTRTGSGDVTVDTNTTTAGNQNTLAFTTSNWSTAQSVTVSAAHDDDEVDDTATINLTGTGITSSSVEVQVLDDDISLRMYPSPLTMKEGETKTIAVKLFAKPKYSRTLTINVASTNSDVTIDTDYFTPGIQTSLSFDSDDWNIPHVVNVTAAQDEDTANNEAVINLTGTGFTDGSVTVKVTDDEIGLTLSKSTLTINEGSTATLKVKLDKQPGSDQMITLSSNNTDVTVSPTTLTFTGGDTGNWDAEKTVTLTAAHDDDTTNDKAVINLTSTGVVDGAVDVTVTDDDIGLTLSKSTLTMNEGGNATFTVKLDKQPGSSQTITLGSNNTDVTVSPTTLTFTSANWDSEQTVTVSAAHDADATDDKAIINLESAGIIDGAVKVTVTDDDIGLELSATELTMDEGGTETFTVRLAEQPGKALTVNLSSSNPDITVDANTSTAGKKTTLTFTAENWNSGQTVTLTAAHDDDVVDDTATINLTGAGIAASSLKVSVIDDDLGLILSETSLRMREGSYTEFRVRLSKQPSFDVMVTLAQPSNTDVTVDTDRDTAGNQHTLHFTKSSWSTDQAVRVHASQDADSTDDIANISITASGGGYDAATGNVAVTVTDQDLLKIVSFTRQIMVEGGSSISFSFKMSVQPSESTTITLGWLSNPDPNPGIAIDTDVLTAGNQNTVTFTTSNWNTAQVVSLSAIDDADSADEGGRLYAGLPDGGEIALRDFQVIDDDVEMILSAISMQLNEGGSSGTFTVRMDGQGGTVRSIGLSSNNSAVTVSPKNLSFNSINWNAAQTVTVSAIQDSDRSNETATISLKNSWETMSGSVEVSAIDDDDSDVGLTLSRTSLTMDEGGTETFTVQLAAQPGNDRTVSLASTNPDVTLDTDAGTPGNQTELTFTPENWSNAQTVTLAAAHDDDSVNDTAAINLTGAGITAGSVEVTVTDDEIDLELSKTELTVNEGGEATFTVKLDKQPASNQTVALRSNNADVRVSPTTLTFTGGNDGNWGTAQTVTLTATEDSDKINETAMINLSGNGIASASVSVSVNDNDGELILSETSLTLTEGQSGSFRVKLSNQISENVTVTLTQPGNTDVTVDTDAAKAGNQNTLLFTASNWSTYQAVQVSAAPDIDTAKDKASISLTAAGGGYDTKTGKVKVTVNDDLFLVSTDKLTVAEGTSGTFTVQLGSPPSQGLFVTEDFNLWLNPAVTFDTDPNTPGNQDRLTFTSSNWSTPQTVTVRADDDANRIDESGILYVLTLDQSSFKELRLLVLDDDIGMTLSATSLVMDEGSSKTFTVQLAHQPGNKRTITLSSTHSDITFSPAELSFSASNWRVAETITIRAPADDNSGNETGMINLSGAGVTNGAVEVTVTDYEVGLTLSETELKINEGGTATFTVNLDQNAGSSQTITLSSSNTDVTVSPTTLTFTTANWITAQSVTVEAAQDADTTDDTAMINLAGTGIVGGAVKVTVTDDDIGLTLSATSLTMNEGGTKTFTVQLASQPGNDRTVRLSSANPDVTIDIDSSTPGNQTELTFTPANWSTAQTVTLTAAEDDDSDSETGMINLSSAGVIDGAVEVTVTDNDTAAAGLSISAIAPEAGSSGSGLFTVQLDSRPDPNRSRVLTADGDAGVHPAQPQHHPHRSNQGKSGQQFDRRRPEDQPHRIPRGRHVNNLGLDHRRRHPAAPA